MRYTARVAANLLLLGAMACGPSWKQYRAPDFGVMFRLPAAAEQKAQFYTYPFGRTHVNYWFARF